MLFRHLINEALLRFYLWRRYWLESIAGFAIILALFVGLLFAVSTFGKLSIQSGTLDGVILGFAIWMFAGAAYSSSASEIAEEIRQRTLQQIAMSPKPLWVMLLVRATVNISSGLTILLLMLIGVDIVTGFRLGLSYLQLLALMALAAPALLGVGLAVAGVLLIARKVDMLQALIYPALVALVSLPAYPVNATILLPFAFGAAAARSAASGQALQATDYVLIVCNSAAWLCAGLVAFRAMDRKARLLGVMGHV